MITENYVSFEIAKLLKEKGFNEPCLMCYTSDGKLGNYGHYRSYKNSDVFSLTAPTIQMAMKWLREVHNIDIIAPPQYDNIKWTYSAVIFKLSIPCTEIRLNDNKDKKEEAFETAIKYCLENLI